MNLSPLKIYFRSILAGSHICGWKDFSYLNLREIQSGSQIIPSSQIKRLYCIIFKVCLKHKGFICNFCNISNMLEINLSIFLHKELYCKNLMKSILRWFLDKFSANWENKSISGLRLIAIANTLWWLWNWKKHLILHFQRLIMPLCGIHFFYANDQLVKLWI